MIRNFRKKLKLVLKRSDLFWFIYNQTRALAVPELFSANRELSRRYKSNKPLVAELEQIEANGRNVLIVNINSSIYQASLDSLFAWALRLRGWRAIAVTSRAHWFARRVFYAFGINDQVFWEDVPLTKQELDSIDAISKKEFGSKELSVSDLKNWHIDGVRIGAAVISWLLRIGHKGSVEIENPAIKHGISAVVADNLAAVVKIRKLIKHWKPGLAIANEANGALFGPIVDELCNHGIDVIQYVQSGRDDALVFKRLNQETRRTHANSLAKVTFDGLVKDGWSSAKEAELDHILTCRYNGTWILQGRNQPGVHFSSKQELIRDLGLDPGKKTACIFSHVLWDATLFYGEDLFSDYGDWFVQTLDAAIKNPKINWVVKLHPANIWKREKDGVTGELAEDILIRKFFGKIPSHVKIIYPDSKISTKSLFESIDFGITVRGTVGIELPVFGVPTITAGTGRYSHLGFTIDSSTKEEYLQRLAAIDGISPMSEREILLAKIHAHGVFVRKSWQMVSACPKYRTNLTLNHPFSTDLEIKINDFREAHDLRKWAAWAESAQVDYMN